MMPKQHKLEHYQIASMQIDQAIDLYLLGNLASYVCATTLAGAGEEILGKLLEHHDKGLPALDGNVIKCLANNGIDDVHKDFEKSKKDLKNELNEPRNMYKHFDERFCDKDFDPQFYAEMMINRAIINYDQLRDCITDKMKNYLDLTGNKENKNDN